MLVQSEPLPADTPQCRGHAFGEWERSGLVDYEALLRSYATTGFQATNFALACDAVRAMVRSDSLRKRCRHAELASRRGSIQSIALRCDGVA